MNFGSSARPAILVEHLVKEYGGRRVVDGVSFAVAAGEVFALLGPNGAGKTTTVEILEGYRRADGGRAQVLGLDPGTGSGRLKDRIGVMLQDPGLYLTITPREALALFSRFYASPRDPGELLELVGLSDAASTRYRNLSGGQKKRLGLALALVGRPEVLFLDEPTAGLDPQARRATWEIIGALRREGVAILLTTHYLEEAERLAQRIGILDRGRLRAIGTPRDLMGDGRTQVRLRTVSPADPAALRQLPSAQEVRAGDEGYLITTGDPPALLVELTTTLRDAAVEIRDLRVGGDLEELFLQMTAEAGTE